MNTQPGDKEYKGRHKSIPKCKECGNTNKEDFDIKDIRGRYGVMCTKCCEEIDNKFLPIFLEMQEVRNNLNTISNRKVKSKYARNKKRKDPAFLFMSNLRVRQNHVFKGRASTTKGLGCSQMELQNHMESLFLEGMTLDNHGKGEGKWHMDHIIPMSSYERTEGGQWNTESEYNKKLIHYTNLRPMWQNANLEKRDKVDEEELANFLNRVI